MIKICAAVAAVLISGTTLGSASAQEARTLKLAGVVPPTHYMAVTADKFFMDKVKELTSGAVDFEYYPAQQLGKANAIMDLTKAGVADIGQQPSAYVLDRLPSSGVAGLPGIANTSCEVTRAMSTMSRPGGLLYAEYEANGVRPIFTVALPQYKVILASKAVREVGDFAGLKLRTDGGVMEMM